MELWSLLSITAPGLFPDPKRFASTTRARSRRGGDAERLARLRRRIKPLVKRRTKEQVAADLPAKQEQILEVELHPRHRKLYDTLPAARAAEGPRAARRLRPQPLHDPALAHAAAPAQPASRARRRRQRRRSRARKLDALVEQLARRRSAAATGRSSSASSPASSPRSRERLDARRHRLLLPRRRARGTAIESLERFKDGAAPVFLISLKAGGFGLNLTEADYCFLLDPWWNPATEAQAIDRTHRIGQTRTVMVYRLIARDTIEEKVVALAQRKGRAVPRRHGRRRPLRKAAHRRRHPRAGRLGTRAVRNAIRTPHHPVGLVAPLVRAPAEQELRARRPTEHRADIDVRHEVEVCQRLEIAHRIATSGAVRTPYPSAAAITRD